MHYGGFRHYKKNPNMTFLTRRMLSYLRLLHGQNEKFLEENARADGVIALDSGLQYKVRAQ